MNAENEFERWWEDTSYGETVPLTDWQLRDICYAAFTLGRKAGMEEAITIGSNHVVTRTQDEDILKWKILDAIRLRIEETK